MPLSQFWYIFTGLLDDAKEMEDTKVVDDAMVAGNTKIVDDNKVVENNNDDNKMEDFGLKTVAARLALSSK